MPFTVTLDFVEAFDSQIETECCPHLGVYLIFFFPLSSVKYLQYHAAFRKRGVYFCTCGTAVALLDRSGSNGK